MDGKRVFLCRYDEFCAEPSLGGNVTATGGSVTIRIPSSELADLPAAFEWRVSASGGHTPNIDNDWSDFLPDNEQVARYPA